MKAQPKKYRAKDINGNVETGWFVMTHMPVYDSCNGNLIIKGYKEVPSIFNDDEGERSKGCYWHIIILDTLEEVKEHQQLKLF